MARDPFKLKPIQFIDPFKPKKPKKRQLTNAQKIWCWENNPHTCNICKKRVTKFSNAEFDHTRAHSKGGASNLKNVKITHRQCNRLKGTKTLSQTRKMLGVKTTRKKRKKGKTRRKKTQSIWDIPQPLKFKF